MRGPSLDLNFLSGAMDPRLSFTRASAAMVYNSAGVLTSHAANVPRFDYDPATARTNLILRSVPPTTTDSPWGVGTSLTVSGPIVAPDGTLTANVYAGLIGTSFNGTNVLQGGGASGLITSATYTVSFYMYSPLGGSYNCRCRSSSGSTVRTISAVVPAGVWTRFSGSFAQDSASSTSLIFGTGSGASNPVAIWGVQFEAGSSATAYIPTAGAAVTQCEPRGLLIEEQRTNSIPNSTMQGAVTGVVGSGGALPTNWSHSGTATLTIVGTGIENGVTYIDVRFQGNSTSSLNFTSTSAVAASSGQVFAISSFLRLAAGTQTNVTVQLGVGWTGASSQNQVDVAIDSVLRRREAQFTAPASTTAVQARVRLAAVGSYDITLRIGLPQLELGYFATSPIPTTSAAATRAADVCSIPTSAFGFNAAEGTLFSEFQWTTTIPRHNAPFVRFDDGTNNNFLQLATQNISGTAPTTISARSGGGATAFLTQNMAATNTGGILKLAGSYDATTLSASVNGGAAGSIAHNGLPAGLNVLRLAAGNTGVPSGVAIYIRRVTYYPRRIDDAGLQRLTA